MKSILLYYSYTGNNAKITKAISNVLQADCVEVKEIKKRTVFTILLDVVFNRTPKIFGIDKHIDSYENLFFVAPVWFGKIATPLRAVFRNLKAKDVRITLIALSAGADGVNPNLDKELLERTGIKSAQVINPLLSDLLPKNPKPSRKVLDSYKISDTEAEAIVANFANKL